MDGPPPVEEDFSVLSIQDRLAHKNWKARVSGYESLAKAFSTTGDEEDPVFRPYLNDPGLLKKMVTDANAVAQEKGVETVLAFVKFGGEPTSRTRDTVIPALVDKCFGSSRQGTKQKSISLALEYIEVENTGEGVIRDIMPGLSAKQPKAVAATAGAIKDAIVAFGAKVIPPLPIFKVLPKIFGHSDKNVRAEGTNIVLSLYSWIGPAILTSLSELKPVQIKELQEAFDAADKDGKGQRTGHQERYTRAQQREREAAAAAPGDAEPEEPEVLELDIPVERVDIIPRLPADFYTQISSSKWKDRKETLDAVSELLVANPHIVDADGISDLVKALALRMPDANINVVMVAASIIGMLAKGIGQPFGRFRTVVVPPMLERLKERKQSVVDAIGGALDEFFTTITFPDLTEQFLVYLPHKNPQVREGTLKFLNRCLSTTRIPPNKPDLKPYSEALVALLADSAEPIRNAASEGLGLLMKIFGERAMNAYLDPLDDVRKGKVKEAFEKASVKCKAGGAPPAPAPSKPAASSKPSAAKSKPPPKKLDDADADGGLLDDFAPPKPLAKPPARLMARKPPVVEDSDPLVDDIAPPKPTAKPPARLLARKAATADDSGAPSSSSGPPPSSKPAPAAAAKKLPPAAAAAMAKVSGNKPSASSSASVPSDSFKYKFNPEDAEARIADAIPPNFAAELGDSAWKVRLAALDETFPEWLEGAMQEVDAELLFRFLSKKPGWNEKNFQVSAKVYGIMCTIAEKSPTFSKACIALSASHLTDKLADIKLKKPASEALMTFAEKTSLHFVLGQCYDPIAKQKAPKNIAEGIAFINQALNDFGVAGLSLKPLVEMLKGALTNSNAAVRTSATSALVTLKVFVGPSVKDLLEGLSPQLLTTIQGEFDKAEGREVPTPTRFSAEVKAAAPGAGGKAGGGDPLDELFPRADLEKIVNATKIIEDAKNDAWKTRREALETLQALLGAAANKRLKPNLGEIPAMLKLRLTDSNKAVQSAALDVVGRIATGMNKPFEKYCRVFIPPIMQAMTDRATAVRVASANTLTAIATACEGVDAMAPAIGAGLEVNNPVSRAAILGWIDSWIKDPGISPSTDLSSWAGPLISCLDDKTADVRKGAMAVLPTVIMVVGYDRVADKTSAVKPASRNGILAQLATAKAAADALGPAPASRSAPAAPAAAPAAAKFSAPAAARSHTPEPEVAAAAAPKKGALARRLIAPSSARPGSRAEMAESAPPTPKAKPMGLKRPLSKALPPPPVEPSSPSGGGCPFVGANADQKRARLAKDANRWIVEAGQTRKELTDLLQAQMEGHVTREVSGLLFSHDHNAINDHIAGLSIIVDTFSAAAAGESVGGLAPEDLTDVLIANVDLPLKYVTTKIHEPQPNLISKCLDVVESVLGFLIAASYVLTDVEAQCFVPTVIHKLGDAREVVRQRVQTVIQTLPKAFSSSRLFSLLLEQGLKSKVNKTRQGALDEMAFMIKKKGMAVCDPMRAFPVIAASVNDKDAATRKSALSVIGEAYTLDGEKVWSYLGRLDPKIQTQVEERLRRMPGASNTPRVPDTPLPAPVTRLASALPRPGSPAGSLRRPAPNGLASPNPAARSIRPSTPPTSSHGPVPTSPSRSATNGTTPTSRLKPLQSRLAPPKVRASPGPSAPLVDLDERQPHRPASPPIRPRRDTTSTRHYDDLLDDSLTEQDEQDEVTITISSILSSDPSRSVDALKKLQKILDISIEAERTSFDFQNLADHTDGLIETIVLQMSHVWDRPEGVSPPENYRLAKHLIQTLNTFCEHPILAESLPVDILTSLLEELTRRLLQSDESEDSKVKDLSRFINMIILKVFDTARRINVFRALFNLLNQITKPFTAKRTQANSREARLAELVLKCLWKLARGIPANLQKSTLDPIEMFPALEGFLQSIPPNEWRARAQAKVPCGDMPLRTIKVIIQHIVAAYGDVVYDYLSKAFDDPSATIVYPYVYRTLNNSPAIAQQAAASSTASSSTPTERATATPPRRPISSDSLNEPPRRSESIHEHEDTRPSSYERPGPSRSRSGSLDRYSRPITPSRNGSGSGSGGEDLDARLVQILDHISSETTGALHKEGITELYQFLKAHPEKQAKVDKMLDATGPQFRKYLARALATRAADDEERKASINHTLSRLESGASAPSSPRSPTVSSPRRTSNVLSIDGSEDKALSRLHDIFHYQGRSSVVLDSRRTSVSSGVNGSASHDPTPLRTDAN